MRRVRLLAASALIAVGMPLDAQDRVAPPYGSSLLFGTGLVNVPVAWVSPSTGDLFAALSARAIGVGGYEPRPSGSLWDLTQSLEAHVGGKVSFGASLYGTRNAEVGAFAKVLLLRQPVSGERWRPSIAVGVRNLGSSARQDRFATGDRRVVDILPDSGLRSGKGRIAGSPTFFGVMTRDFLFEKNSASFSVGYGNGLFREDGGLDTVYNRHGTLLRGLLLGGRLVVPAGKASVLTFVAENDGWDWNAGALVTFRHVSIGLYLTELEEAKGVPGNKPLANFTKSALLFAYDASIPEIVRGSRQRAEAAEAQVEMRRLSQEIAQRKVRTAELQAQMAAAQRGADRTAVERRAELQRQLDAEAAAMKKAGDKLEELSRKTPPGEAR